MTSLWPGKIIKTEITGADCYYTDGSATEAHFKLEFSEPGYHVFYVKKDGSWFSSTINTEEVLLALKNWLSSSSQAS